jgi:hypothetical protein
MYCCQGGRLAHGSQVLGRQRYRRAGSAVSYPVKFASRCPSYKRILNPSFLPHTVAQLESSPLHPRCSPPLLHRVPLRPQFSKLRESIHEHLQRLLCCSPLTFALKHITLTHISSYPLLSIEKRLSSVSSGFHLYVGTRYSRPSLSSGRPLEGTRYGRPRPRTYCECDQS